MNSEVGSTKSEHKKEEGTDKKDSLKKKDIYSKIILGVLGILITFFLQYNQLRQAKLFNEIELRNSEIYEEVRRNYEKTKIEISKTQLAGNLIGYIIKGNSKERRVAITLLEYAAPEMYLRILEALAYISEDKQIKKQTLRELGEKGDKQSLEMVSKIAKSNIPDDEKAAAKKSQHILVSRFLKNAMAMYETGHTRGVVDEFNKIDKIENLPRELDVDLNRLELARIAYRNKDYESAAQHYVKAFEKVYQTIK